MKFAYIETSASVGVKGDIFRLLSDSEALAVYLEKGCVSVDFRKWWNNLSEDTRKAWTNEKGEIVDPEYGTLDSETGEPVTYINGVLTSSPEV